MGYLLKNGILIDGSGQGARRADLRIVGDLIQELGPGLSPRRDEVVLDLKGAWLTPGFIDCHSHSDLAVSEPGGLDPKLLQGVTTEVAGQCGLSVFPLPEKGRAAWRESSVIGNPAFDWGWERAEAWFASLPQAGLTCNFIPFVGAGTLRYAVKGYDPAPLDRVELERYQSLLEEAFESGVAGLSFGLIYLPAIFSRPDELELAAGVAARHGRPLAVHLRSESDELLLAVKEMLELGRTTGVRLHLSHLKAIGEKNLPQLERVLALIEREDLDFDHYPYTWGSTSLLSLIPPRYLTAGLPALLADLAEPGLVDELDAIWSGRRLVEGGQAWDNLPLLVGWEKIRLISAAGGAGEGILGLSLAKAAELNETTPGQLLASILTRSKGDARMTDEYTEEEVVERLLREPRGSLASDSLFGGQLHPRVRGSFPRVFERYVFKRKVLGLEEAVYKMTGAPAKWLGLEKRGLVRPGFYADLVVFDQEIGEPKGPSESVSGIRYVILNGVPVVEAGKRTGASSGRLILMTG